MANTRPTLPIFVHHGSAMNTPQAKSGTSATPAARSQSAPPASNAVRTDVDMAYIDGVAYPINKNEYDAGLHAPAHRALHVTPTFPWATQSLPYVYRSVS